MGINNIGFLISDGDIHITLHPPESSRIIQAQAAYAQTLIEAHRRGEHPWGNMRRDCPLCQLNK